MDVLMQDIVEDEVIQGVDASLSKQRLGAVKEAAEKVSQNDKPEMESTKVRQGVSETVKELESETEEVFPDKDTDSPEMKTAKEKAEEEAKEKESTKPEKKILGMKPIYAIGLGVALVITGVLIYYKFKKKKA